jgi:hypothetical protein
MKETNTKPCTCLVLGEHPNPCAQRYSFGRCIEHLAKQKYFERLREEKSNYNREYER